jgi:hypothetical protein
MPSSNRWGHMRFNHLRRREFIPSTRRSGRRAWRFALRSGGRQLAVAVRATRIDRRQVKVGHKAPLVLATSELSPVREAGPVRPCSIPLETRRLQRHTRAMPDKHPKDSHNPSQKSLQRWDNEGGAPKGGRDRGSAQQTKTAKRNPQAHKSTRSKAR